MNNYVAEMAGALVRLTDKRRSQVHDLPPKVALEIGGSLRCLAAHSPNGDCAIPLSAAADMWFRGSAAEATTLADALDFAARRVMKAHPQKESAD